MSEYTMAIIVNQSLQMSAGKTAAQSAHGAVTAAMTALGVRKEVLDNWINQGQRKICLRGLDESVLLSFETKCAKKRIQYTEIRDAGLTEIPANSLTVIVLGPGSKSKIEALTASLQLY
jgi:PTH2 family peptidyl-tRNA hydrolase